MGDEDRPDAPDPFEGLTLDEEFVRGAEVVEESAEARLARLARIDAEHKRLAEARKGQQAELDRSLRRQARKARRGARMGGHWQRFVVIAAIVAVAGGLVVWNMRNPGGTSALGGGPFGDASSGSVVGSARPPAGVGEADEPLGVPAELARESSEQRKHLALASLAGLLGLPEPTLRAALVCPIQHHDFSNDSHIRGAYSFCRPGGVAAAKALSAPVGGALFLAGEATCHDYPGTVAGAIASGERAAQQVLSVLES